jgi:hypothetical protein
MANSTVEPKQKLKIEGKKTKKLRKDNPKRW